jgi:hypothetical protein
VIPEAPLQAADLGAHLRAQLRVEVRERFVEQQHARLDYDGARQGDALLLAAGKLVRHLFLVGRKPDQREHLGHGAAHGRAVHALDLQAVGDVLEHRKVRKQCVVLEHEPDIAPVRLDAVTLRSPIQISPALGSWKPAIIRSVVVLPQPDGPSSVISSPGVTSRLTSRTAAMSPFTGWWKRAETD